MQYLSFLHSDAKWPLLVQLKHFLLASLGLPHLDVVCPSSKQFKHLSIVIFGFTRHHTHPTLTAPNLISWSASSAGTVIVAMETTCLPGLRDLILTASTGLFIAFATGSKISLSVHEESRSNTVNASVPNLVSTVDPVNLSSMAAFNVCDSPLFVTISTSSSLDFE